MALLHRRSTSKRASQKMWENNAAMPDDASANDNVSSARPEPAAFVPTPFDEVIDISDLVAERRRLATQPVGDAHHHHCAADRRNRRGLLPASVAIRVRPQLGRHHSHHGQRSSWLALPASGRQAHGGPAPYNKKLAESGQPILGEAVDPFAAAQGGSQASGEDSASKKDKEYQSLLNTGNGVMGTIKVPKQSINPAVLSRHFRGSTGFWCRPLVRHVAAGGR